MTTKEMIAVMQASEEGKTIEYRWNRQYKPQANDKWESHAEPSWNWPEFEYRVKPEPMEIEVWTKLGEGYTPHIGHDPKFPATRPDEYWIKAGWTKKKFREVIE